MDCSYSFLVDLQRHVFLPGTEGSSGPEVKKIQKYSGNKRHLITILSTVLYIGIKQAHNLFL